MTSSKKLIQASAGVGGGDFYPYMIENSVRAEHGPSTPTRLYRTNTTGGNRQTWTMSFWMKKCRMNTLQYVFAANVGATWPSTTNNFMALSLQNDVIGMSFYTFNAIVTNPVFRDASSWYNIVIAFDSTQGAASNRLKLYVNGVEVTSFSTDSRASISQNGNYAIGASNTLLNINGAYTTTAYNGIDGYYSQYALVDGQQLPPTDFGEFKNGVWVPKDPSGLTFGNNGFYLDFSNSAALGTDVSGNNNDFTSSGLTASDQMIDTPTNNFCTFTPLDTINSPTLSEGNLKIANSSTGVLRATMGIEPNTGKWYWEVKQLSTVSGSTPMLHGLGCARGPITHSKFASGILAYTDNATNHGKFYSENNIPDTAMTADLTPVITGVAINDVWQFMYDSDAGEFFVGVDEVWYDATGGTTSNPETGANPFHTFTTNELGTLMPVHDHAGAASTVVYDFGQSGFAYTPPSDSRSLCTANLPEPTIGPNSDILPSDCFATVLYTGNGTAIGSGGKAVTGVGFQPDMVWIKNRDAADQWMCFDSVRGATKFLSIDGTDVEVTNTETLNTFDADGFTLGSNNAVNTSGEDYVAYCFKITAGFFDIQPYVGNQTARTISHDLGVEPNLYMVKNRDAANGWYAYVSSLPVTDPETDAMTVHTNAAVADVATYWNDTAPTSSVFSIGSSGTPNGNTYDYICYLFADVEGFCKTGYYEGNGNADGSFEYKGFSPILHINKRTDAAASWNVYDTKRSPYNPMDKQLKLDLPDADNTTSGGIIDALSNGVKLRGTGSTTNASGGDYITLSIGTSFKYSNAR